MITQDQAARFDVALNVNQALIGERDRRSTDKPAGVALDAQIAQLVAMFKASDERGRALLLKIAGIHSTCYPKKA